MKIIAIANQKGGVGKTTTSVNFAIYLKHAGYKVLLIDADQQANSTDTFRAIYEDKETLYDCWLTGELDINDCIQRTEIGDIVAADPLLREAESKIAKDPINGLLSFKKMLNKLIGYDFVIIDCPPTAGALLQSILVAADEVIIPITADRYSIQGADQIWTTIKNVKDGLNPKLKLSGFLLVKYNTRTNLNKDIFVVLSNIANDIGTIIFNTYIRESTKAREALTDRQTLFTFAPKCTTAIDYESFTKEYLERRA